VPGNKFKVENIDYLTDCGHDPFKDTYCKSSSHELTLFGNNQGNGYHFLKK